MYGRGWLIAGGVAALALASCSKKAEQGPDRASPDLKTGEVSGSRSAPDIGPSAAPGVAFNYKYDFLLADEAISGVQEAHAAACERLGMSRCRITGLNYTIGDNDTVSASLDVKLSPEIARTFGKEATGTVAKAGGRLSHTEFAGEDTAPTTEAATVTKADVEQRIADIEKRLAMTGAKDVERAQLQAQLADLRQQASGAKSTLSDQRAKLASTPMSFQYYGKGGISGFAGHNPVIDAGRSFVASVVAMITIVLQFLAYVLPWVLLLSLLVILWRTPPTRAAVRWWRGVGKEKPADELVD